MAQLGFVILYTRDVVKKMAFYERAFGLQNPARLVSAGAPTISGFRDVAIRPHAERVVVSAEGAGGARDHRKAALRGSPAASRVPPDAEGARAWARAESAADMGRKARCTSTAGV
jgi:hypothetical protein